MLKNNPGLTQVVTAGLSAVGPNSTHSHAFGGNGTGNFFDPSQARNATQSAFSNGADFYKIVAEVNGPSLESQVALVNNVTALGKQTMTHAATVEAYIQAIQSGANGIQHLPQDGVLNSSMIARMLAQGQTVTPTISVFQYEYTEPAIDAAFSVPFLNSSAAIQQLDWVMHNARNFYEAGITILAGTDAVGVVQLSPKAPAINLSLIHI